MSQIIVPTAAQPIVAGAQPAPKIQPVAPVAGMPSVFARLGFTPIAQLHRRLFITSEGPTGSGKTRFIRTMPGPIGVIDFDRGTEGVLDTDIHGRPIMHKVIEFAEFDEGAKTMTAGEWASAKENYQLFKYLMEELVKSGDVRTVAVDTGGAAYALAQAARFGRIAQVGEVPPALWTSMQHEFENIFLRAYDYGCNLIVTHRQGTKFKGLSGERELKGYRQMPFVGQVHLVHDRKIVKMPNGPDRLEMSIRIDKCRQRLGLVGHELPVVLLGEGEDGEMRSMGGDFVDVARLVFPQSREEEWI